MPDAAALLRLAVCVHTRAARRSAAAHSAPPPRRIRHTNRARRDRRHGSPGSARADRIPAMATARWHRSFAPNGWPARRRGRDRRHRRQYRGSRARPAPGAGLGARCCHSRGAGRRCVRGSAAATDPASGSAAVAAADFAASADPVDLGGRPDRAADARCAKAAARAIAGAMAAGSKAAAWEAAAARLRPASDWRGWRRGTRRRPGCRRRCHARPRGRAGRLRIRPCARPLPATAARA